MKEILNKFLLFTKNTELTSGIEQCGCGKSIWSSEDWTVEVTRALMCKDYNDYDKLSFPEKFSNEPAFKSIQPRIIEAVVYKMNFVKILEKIKDRVENLYIGEVGRGLDILVSLNVKNNWKNVFCYDRQISYKNLIERFFTEYLSSKIHFYCNSGYQINVSDVPPKTVFVVNHSIEGLKQFTECENITHIIRNGKLIKGEI